MAAASISASLHSLPAKREKFQKAFSDLDSQRALLGSCALQWKELEEYFSEMEESIRRAHAELRWRETDLEAKSRLTIVILDRREEAISVREEESLDRVQQQKDAAIAAIVEEKRKLEEVRGSAAVASSVARTSNGAAKAMDADAAASKDTSSAGGGGAVNGSGSEDAGAKRDKSEAAGIRVRPQLTSLCERMDGEGLMKYIVGRRKDIPAVRNELPSAFQSAIDPARLLLKALEGYDLPGPDASGKDTGDAAQRRACILLLESLSQVLADPVLGLDLPVVPSIIKESAKEVAARWRSKLDIQGNVNALDAHAFLQLLATFGIASEYNDDELCELATSIARRRQAPDLCRSLGLTAKIPDVVDKLAAEGKQIEALSFANEFRIMDKVQPVALLKAYLKEARKAAQALSKKSSGGGSSQNEATAKELSALKAVLKAIEEYKLESQYPTENLLKRVAQLEKSKADKKRAAVSVKAQSKRLRGSGGLSAVAPSAARAPAEKLLYRPSERVQFGVAAVPSYNAPITIDRRTQVPVGGHGPAYAVSSRNPISMPSSYLYGTDGLGRSMYGSSAYSNTSRTHGSYQYGARLQTASAYQPSFIR